MTRRTRAPAPVAETPASEWDENAHGNNAETSGGNDPEEHDPEADARARAAQADEADPDIEEGDDDFAADLAAVSNVDHDAVPVFEGENGDGLAIGSALTPAQQAGIDPVDLSRHVRQANDRAPLNNGQTDHEAANALDAVSGTANPGVTRNNGHSAPGALGASDMSGRAPVPDAGLGTQARVAMGKLQEASRKAIADRKRGHGYLNVRELGVNKAVMDALVLGGHVKRETRTGAQFNPETGVVYRVSDHVEPELPPPADA